MTPNLHMVPKSTPGAPKTEAPDTGMAAKPEASADNAILSQIQANVMKTLPPKMTRSFHQIMAAGRKAMFSEQTFPEMTKYLGSIQSPDQIPQYVAHGVIKLLTLIMNQSQGKMSVEAVGPAAVMFMCDALEYLQDVKKMPIEKAVIDQTTLMLKDGLITWVKAATKISEEDWGKVVSGQGRSAPTEKPAIA